MRTKLVIAISIVLLISCAAPPVNVIPTETAYFGIDFSKYTKAGFLMTPEKYNGKFESIGMVTYVLVPGAKLEFKQRKQSDGSVITDKTWIRNKVTASQGIDSLYSQSVAMGANAIINFSIKSIQRSYNTNGVGVPVSLEGFEISGYAIKRKDD